MACQTKPWRSLAERVGVEPTIPLLAGYTISNRAPSASRASLRFKHLPQHGLPATNLTRYLIYGALNHVRFRASHAPYANPEPDMVQDVVRNSWRRAPCKVHGCHAPYVVHGGEGGRLRSSGAPSAKGFFFVIKPSPTRF
jgi:hypothetical protein